MMICPSNRPRELNITLGLEHTDDEKTPEYPLNDEHPLSLNNRAKLLNTRSELSSKHERITPLLTQSNQATSTETMTTFGLPSQNATNSTCDIPLVRVSQSLRPLSFNEKFGSPFGRQKITQERTDTKPPNTAARGSTWMSVMEALDLASELKPSFKTRDRCVSKQRISLLVNSLLDYNVKGNNVLGLVQVDGDLFMDKLSSVWKISDQVPNIQHFYPVSSTDSNNNSGGLSPKTTKVSHSPVAGGIGINSVFDLPMTDASKTQSSDKEIYEFKPSPSVLYVNKHEIKPSCDIGIDVEEKNLPPHLSPVKNVSPKSVVTVSSHFPSFPPTLTPINKTTSFRNITFDPSSTVESHNEKSLVQSSLGRSDSVVQSKNVIVTTNDKYKRDSVEKSPTVCQALKTSNNSRDGAWVTSPSSHYISSDAQKENELELKSKQMINSSLTQKNIETDSKDRMQTKKEVSDNNTWSKNQSEFGSQYSDGSNRKKSSSDKFQIKEPHHASSARSKKLKKSWSSKQPNQTKPDKMDDIYKTKADTPFSAQRFYDSHAESVASGTSYLCYPHSYQNISSNDKPETRDETCFVGMSQNDTKKICADDVDDGKIAGTVVAMPSHAHKIPGSSLHSFQKPVVSLEHIYMPRPHSYNLQTSTITLSSFLPSSPGDLVPFTSLTSSKETPLTKGSPATSPLDVTHFSLNSAGGSTVKGRTTCENQIEDNSKQHQSPSHNINGTFRSYERPTSTGTILTMTSRANSYENSMNAYSLYNGSSLLEQKMTSAPEVINSGDANVTTSQEISKTAVSPISKARNNFPLSFVSESNTTSSYKQTAHQVYDTRTNLNVNNDTVYSFSDSDSAHSHRPVDYPASSSKSGNGQSEPLDLSSRSPTSHRKPPHQSGRMFNATELSPHDKEPRLKNVKNDRSFSSERDHSIVEATISRSSSEWTLIDERKDYDIPLNNTNENHCMSMSSSNKNYILNERVDNNHPVSDSEGQRKYSYDIHNSYADELSLPNEPNLVIDIGDNECESFSLNGAPEKKKWKSRPVEDYLHSNPDDKSYSQLALAAITSKKKKSLESCNIPSENEDFLAFLRRDGDSLNKNVQRLSEKENIDFVSRERLKNGEFIDLTEENEDVLSISSDEDMVLSDEPGKGSENEKHRSFNQENRYSTSSISAMKLASEGKEHVYGGLWSDDFTPGDLNERKSFDNGESANASETVLPHRQGESPKTNPYDNVVNTPLQVSSAFQETFSVVDHSQLFRIKEQSLAFSRPQKALMAKRIQNIISKNTQLLPENMRPFETIASSSSQTCFIPDVRKHSEGDQANLFKSEIPLSSLPPPNADFYDSHNGIPTSLSGVVHSMPVKFKKSLSVEIDSHSSIQPPEVDFAPRSNLAVDHRQPSHYCEFQLNGECDTTNDGALAQPHSNTETIRETLSPYKTVWQTHFVTSQNDSNDDVLQRLELMHNAKNSINQSLHGNSNKESISIENTDTSNRRHRLSKVKRVNQDERDLPELCCDPIPPAVCPDSHSNYVHLPPPPSQSGPLSPCIHSAFLVAPCYAMAYPVCYPAFQKPTSPRSMLMLSYNAALDDVENQTSASNQRKRTRRTKTPGDDPGPRRKRTAKKAKQKIDSESEHIPENISNEILQNGPNCSIETETSHFVKTTTIYDNTGNNVQTTVTNNNITNANAQDTRSLRSHSPVDQSNLQELLSSESNYKSCYMHTRNEDGLMVLSMQYAGELQSNEPEPISSNNVRAEMYPSFKSSCRADLDLLKPVSTAMEISHASSCDSSADVTSLSPQLVTTTRSIGQNLATLAFASERQEKILSPMCPLSRTETEIDTDTTFSKFHKDDMSLPLPKTKLLQSDMRCSPDSPCNFASQTQTQTADKASLPQEENPVVQSAKMNGIAEKEKAVTEILAAMMQNRNTMTFEYTSV